MWCGRSVMTVWFLPHSQSWKRCDLPRRSGLEHSYLEEGRRWDFHLVSAGLSMEKALIRDALMQSPALAMSRSGVSSVVDFLAARLLHPVRTHLVPFQILTLNGQPPRAEERGWKDTVAVDRDEAVNVIMRWSGYRGRYLLHCHNLEHEDHSMMARVDVI